MSLDKTLSGEHFTINYFTVMAPDWVVNLASKVLRIGLIDPKATEYFEDLCASVIEARQKDTVAGKDFLQTLTNNMVEPVKGDPGLMADERGRLWTKEGGICLHNILSLH